MYLIFLCSTFPPLTPSAVWIYEWELTMFQHWGNWLLCVCCVAACGARYKTRPGLAYHYSHFHNGLMEEDGGSPSPKPPSRSNSGWCSHLHSLAFWDETLSWHSVWFSFFFLSYFFPSLSTHLHASCLIVIYFCILIFMSSCQFCYFFSSFSNLFWLLLKCV